MNDICTNFDNVKIGVFFLEMNIGNTGNPSIDKVSLNGLFKTLCCLWTSRR